MQRGVLGAALQFSQGRSAARRENWLSARGFKRAAGGIRSKSKIEQLQAKKSPRCLPAKGTVNGQNPAGAAGGIRSKIKNTYSPAVQPCGRSQRKTRRSRPGPEPRPDSSGPLPDEGAVTGTEPLSRGAAAGRGVTLKGWRVGLDKKSNKASSRKFGCKQPATRGSSQKHPAPAGAAPPLTAKEKRRLLAQTALSRLHGKKVKSESLG